VAGGEGGAPGNRNNGVVHLPKTVVWWASTTKHRLLCPVIKEARALRATAKVPTRMIRSQTFRKALVLELLVLLTALLTTGNDSSSAVTVGAVGLTGTSRRRRQHGSITTTGGDDGAGANGAARRLLRHGLASESHDNGVDEEQQQQHRKLPSLFNPGDIKKVTVLPPGGGADERGRAGGGGGGLYLTTVDEDALPDGAKLGVCSGDCDSDADCQDGLECARRDDYERVQGCLGTGEKDQDYCVDPAARIGSDTLTLIGEGIEGLGTCEGDCDSDSDCAGSLRCYDRTGSEKVHGCDGEADAIEGRDFCFDPFADGAPHRLKMFGWENYSGGDGHRGRWCAECDSRCEDGEKLEVGSCSSSSDDWQFVNMDAAGTKTQVQLKDSNLCWQMEDDDDREIVLKVCDPTESCQQFGSGRGNFKGYRFEFVACNGKCTTQDHYPRSGEDLYASSCSRARDHKSSYWEKY